MIFSLHSAEIIISVITFFIAYLITKTAAGYMRAFTAKQLGDDTAERAGFLSLNPMVHMDPFGVIALFLLGIGWGRHVPINYQNIRGKASLALAYFSNVLTYILIAIVSLTTLVKLFGMKVIYLTRSMLFADIVSLNAFLKTFPLFSSTRIASGVVLVALMYLSILFAIIHFIIQGIELCVVLYFPNDYRLSRGGLLNLLLTIMLFVLLIDPLRRSLINLVVFLGYILAQLLGVS